MHKPVLVLVATIAMLSLFASAASAQRLSAAGKCEAAKNQEAGKYAACLHKAEARLIKLKGTCSLTSATACIADSDCPPLESCVKDTGPESRYGTAVTKCQTKFDSKWGKLEAAAATKGDVCPDGLLFLEIQDAVDDHVANIAGALAGEGLTTCTGELVVCEDDLTTCETSLDTVVVELTECADDLTVCDTDLTTCEGDLVVALECGDGDVDAGEDCDLGNLAGATCISEGFTGGVLRCGAGCVYDTSECYAARFVDNADGTITDNETGLMWEKKVKLDSTTDIANRQDADNFYRWSGTCSVATSKRCQPNAAAEAACLAGVEGDPAGCSQCTGGEGTCTVSSPGVTVWQWLNDLNTANYGGHNDWRMPRLQDLLTIVDYADSVPPAVNEAFHGVSCGVACTDVTDPACSCTRSLLYWSASTYAPNPIDAWLVNFTDGGVGATNKTNNFSVRAVRGGS